MVRKPEEVAGNIANFWLRQQVGADDTVYQEKKDLNRFGGREEITTEIVMI